jgi:hypothetical protein
MLLDTSNEILKFEKTFTNEGSGYDMSTGLFPAPVGGLYQFSVHTCVRQDNFAYLGLVLEDNVIASDSNYCDKSHG